MHSSLIRILFPSPFYDYTAIRPLALNGARQSYAKLAEVEAVETHDEIKI